LGIGRWAEISPELELDLDGVKRLHPLPLGALEALDAQHFAQRAGFLERREQALTTVVKDELYQHALELHAELEAEAEAWRDRAAVRESVAAYLRNTVFPWAVRDRGFEGAKEYLLHSQSLEDARKAGVWGVDPHQAFIDDKPRPVLSWSGRAGQVKLCPDDARNEAQRVAAMYSDRLKVCDAGGYVLRYAVFTLPNFAQHHLGAGVDEIKQRFKERITHALRDGYTFDRDRRGRKRTRTLARNMREEGRLFPDLVGALACIEAPLSGRYDTDPSNAWNVHLNAILVFRASTDQPYGRPDYEPIRAAWGADVHFSMIPQGDADATAAALRECIKYPLQTVAEKSSGRKKIKRDRFGNVLTPAPPMIEWPPELFDEWWRAFKGVRRAWSCGVLYSRKMRFSDELVIELPKPARPDAERREYFGTVTLSSAGFHASRPRRDFRELEREKRRRAFEHRARMSTDPAYADAYRAKIARAEHRRDHLRRRREASDAWFTWILGNISAEKIAVGVGERLRVARGPPG
jgi:hypothetical protein